MGELPWSRLPYAAGGDAAERTGGPPAPSPGSPGMAAAFDWFPLGVLLLTADASAAAVNPAWTRFSAMSADRSLGEGWLDSVEPLDRAALRARLRLAAAAGEPGTADCIVMGPAGRRPARWWWQPGPDGGLVVCAAPLGDGQHRQPGQRGSALPATGENAVLELGAAMVSRISAAGLILASAASITHGAAASRIHDAVQELDALIRDTRAAIFELLASPDEG